MKLINILAKIQRGQHTMKSTTSTRTFRTRLMRGTAFSLSLLLAMVHSSTVFATIDNTVTVNANSPTGPIPPVTANENVDVINAAPQISINKTHTFAPGGDANSNGLVDAGDVILFSYIVTNAGNVSLANIAVTDTLFDGTGAAPTILVPASVTTDAGPATGDSVDTNTADALWGKLGPADVVTFTSTYTVTAGDISGAGGGSPLDNDIDTTGQAVGSYDPGTGSISVSANDADPVPLNVVPSMLVSKVASPDTNVAAGTTVTYTYTITNNGTVPLTNVTLTDDVTAGSGPDPVPVFVSWTNQAGSSVNTTTNVITTLNPGAVAVFTGSYVVTQNDVDTRQ